MIPILMPQVGQDIAKAKIVEWLKWENDRVEKGEVVLVVESEKATFEVEAEQSGVLLKILFKEGEETEVLKPVGYLEADVGPGPIVSPASEALRVSETSSAGQSPPGRQASPSRPLASPSARRIAEESHVDLAAIRGSGPGGRVIKRDLPQEAKAPPPMPVQDTVVPFGKMRRRIAERLQQSVRDIPHFYVSVDVDMTEAMRIRRDFNARQGTHVTVTDLVIKAAAAALREHPRLNALVQEPGMVLRKNINIGVAVAVPEGLLVPVIPDADRKGVQEISDLSVKHAEAARRGVMSGQAAGTFTITSLGMHGVRRFVPIINPPECAILAVGAVEPRVVPVSGGIGVREMMTLTLGCDHRAVDGADAAGLLNAIKSHLQSIPPDLRQWG